MINPSSGLDREPWCGSEIIKETHAYGWSRNRSFQPSENLQSDENASALAAQMSGPISQLSALRTEPHESAKYTVEGRVGKGGGVNEFYKKGCQG
ncbi:MAG TPA: hypothetical protein VGL74_05350, partial [Terriglobales bacterium]